MLNVGVALQYLKRYVPDSKVHGANMGPTLVMSAPYGPHVGPMNLAMRGILSVHPSWVCHIRYADLKRHHCDFYTATTFEIGKTITGGFESNLMKTLNLS